jgi:hypothetical protein
MTDVELDDGAGVKPGAIAAGAILLVVGVTLLLDRAGFVATPLRQLIAPGVLITLGALMIVEKGGVFHGYHQRLRDGARPRLRRRGGSTGGLWLIGIGLWMVISQIHLWGFDYHNSWPLFIILSGLLLLVRGIR